MSSSTSPDDSPSNQDNASSSGSNAARPAGNADAAVTVAAAVEKTISCVSCRKRKLKCDRTKPKCGTCSRLSHTCEYPERRRNLGSKRRNMKELEARLAEVETKLVSETSKNVPPTNNFQPISLSTDSNWNDSSMNMNDINMNLDLDFGREVLMDNFHMPDPTMDFQVDPDPEMDFEIISLGLQEPLPPPDMMDELHEIYFDKYHHTMPMIHKRRYLTGLQNPPHMRPPICLRYAIWAVAATLSDKYTMYEDLLYERARKYIEQAEMKGYGQEFVTVQHAQAWCLISTFEAKKTYFTRAWMSSGRTVRLVHMLSLHRIDGSGLEVKQILPPAKDWTEQEERRRTFWAAFYSDRWASSGTGWPMIIVEKTISTDLPASEEAFESGIMQSSISFQEAFTTEGISKITSFGGVILSACFFGHNFEHLHLTGPDEHPESLENGEFWKRHRKMDNILANIFMFLPDHLRLPTGVRDMNVVFLHMNIHASIICLHQAAVATGEKHKINPNFVRQCRARSLMAAEEIANNMRLISHLDASTMNSWMGFCLYVASGVFIQDQVSEQPSSHSKGNLEFLVLAMKAIGNRHSITNHFTAQVELDMESSGINRNNKRSVHEDHGFIDTSNSSPDAAHSNDAPEGIFSFASSHIDPFSGTFVPRTMSNQCFPWANKLDTATSSKGSTTCFQKGSITRSEMSAATPLYGIMGVDSQTTDPQKEPNTFMLQEFAARNPVYSTAALQSRDRSMQGKPNGTENTSVTEAPHPAMQVWNPPAGSPGDKDRWVNAMSQVFSTNIGLQDKDKVRSNAACYTPLERYNDSNSFNVFSTFDDGSPSTNSSGDTNAVVLDNTDRSSITSNSQYPYRVVDPCNLSSRPYSHLPNSHPTDSYHAE